MVRFFLLLLLSKVKTESWSYGKGLLQNTAAPIFMCFLETPKSPKQ